MSARTLLRSARGRSSQSGRRWRLGRGTGVRRRRSRKRGRALVIGGTLAVGALAALGVANRDAIEDAFREVTLPLRHDDIIRQQSTEKGVPADLIAAVIYAESRFRDQTSHAGARGLMQITPSTAREIEKLSGGQTFKQQDLADPDLNIRYGTFYLRHLLNVYGGNEVAAIAAYNAGPNKVEEWGGSEIEEDDIDLMETREYVDEVLDKREEYADHYSEDLGLD
jgi:soluble lytic murein transglycosylase